jgi:hypothetical protein
MPVKEDTTADPPVNNIAVTRMFVIKPNTVKTICAPTPYLALITSRKVYYCRDLVSHLFRAYHIRLLHPMCFMLFHTLPPPKLLCRTPISNNTGTEREKTHMSIRRPSLQLNRNRSKQQDLHRSTRCIPEWTRNTIFIRHTRALQKRSGPCPGGNNS